MLPKIDHPLFELTLPTSQQKVRFRPYTTKEQKILLIAKQMDEPQAKLDAIKQILNNTIQDKINVDDLPMVDMEYAFLKIRAKSVNNISKLAFRDREDDNVYHFEIDLDKIEVQHTEGHTNKIMINSDLGIIMKYPNVKMILALRESTNEVDVSFDLIRRCIETVFDTEDVYIFSENTEEEQIEFIESLPVEVFDRINDFFTSMPKLKHEMEYKNKKGSEIKIVLKGLDDFFQWA